MTPVAVVQFSTGLASAEVAFRAVEAGREVVVVTADTTIEDEDNWRMAHEVHAALGVPEWVVLCDGRDPMQVGRDERVVPNDRMAVCSKILKRQTIRRYMDERWGSDPASIEVLLGYDWTEPHRHHNSVRAWSPFSIDSPLLRPPYWQKGQLDEWEQRRGIKVPRLYRTGAPHANCGGGCVRAGQVEWRRKLFTDRDGPHGYMWWEREEERTRAMLGKDVSILRRRSGPDEGRPLTLRQFRQDLEDVPSLFDVDDHGACGCDPFGDD